MKELEQKLQDIFDKRKVEYQAVFNSGEGLQAKADNAHHFSRINEEFINEMIATANTYLEKNSSASKDESQEIIKNLIPKFTWLLMNPFN